MLWWGKKKSNLFEKVTPLNAESVIQAIGALGMQHRRLVLEWTRTRPASIEELASATAAGNSLPLSPPLQRVCRPDIPA